jgi:hypothetical protein
MPMTRRDYVVIAEILNLFKDEIDTNTFEDLIDEFSDMFSADNPNFKFDKFYAACTKTEAQELELMQSGTRYNKNL